MESQVANVSGTGRRSRCRRVICRRKICRNFARLTRVSAETALMFLRSELAAFGSVRYEKIVESKKSADVAAIIPRWKRTTTGLQDERASTPMGNGAWNLESKASMLEPSN